jgi:hypothetical protein
MAALSDGAFIDLKQIATKWPDAKLNRASLALGGLDQQGNLA